MLPGVGQPDEKDSPAATPEEFDWTGDNVVLLEQPATAVYFNRDGDLVIRQRATFQDDDPAIFITAGNIDRFLDKLCDACGIFSAGKP
jgi:hypothetical protein